MCPKKAPRAFCIFLFTKNEQLAFLSHDPEAGNATPSAFMYLGNLVLNLYEKEVDGFLHPCTWDIDRAW